MKNGLSPRKSAIASIERVASAIEKRGIFP